MKKDEIKFLKALIGIIAIFSLLILVSLFVLTVENISIIKNIFLIVMIILLGIIVLILWFMFTLYKISKDKVLRELDYKLIKGILGIIYPFLISISKVFKIDIDSIRRVYGKINNFLIKTKTIKVKSNDILILLPHCLQDSNCQYKITNDINNCRMCGICDIKDIINITNKYNVSAVVATGGTLAREWIKKHKPRAIIAVACERDLASGINDVKVIPVMGVFNDRPNGPCFNTKVSISKLEEAIKTFIKEE